MLCFVSCLPLCQSLDGRSQPATAPTTAIESATTATTTENYVLVVNLVEFPSFFVCFFFAVSHLIKVSASVFCVWTPWSVRCNTHFRSDCCPKCGISCYHAISKQLVRTCPSPKYLWHIKRALYELFCMHYSYATCNWEWLTAECVCLCVDKLLLNAVDWIMQ